MRRRHPLVDDHASIRLRRAGSGVRRQAAPCRSPGGTAAALRAPAPASNCRQKSNATCGRGARAARRRIRRRSRAACRRSPSAAAGRPPRAAPSTIASCSVGVRHDRVHQRARRARILVLEQHAGAVHRRRHGGRGVGEHRHLLVERLDDRHAEAFVLAGAEKQIGDVVEGDQLLVRDVADEVHVRRRRARRPAGAATRGSARTRCSAPTISSRERGLNMVW